MQLKLFQEAAWGKITARHGVTACPSQGDNVSLLHLLFIQILKLTPQGKLNGVSVYVCESASKSERERERERMRARARERERERVSKRSDTWWENGSKNWEQNYLLKQTFCPKHTKHNKTGNLHLLQNKYIWQTHLNA